MYSKHQGLIIGEVFYVLCGKLQNGLGLLTAAEHDKAVRSFQAQMNAIEPLTFDEDLYKQAAKNAPAVKTNLLLSK